MIKKIVTIIGARPQFIKASAISRTLINSFSDELKEIIVHTGQHYDYGMSDVFFKELSIPHPNYNLNVGSKSHGEQTGRMLIDIEKVLIDEKPDLVIVYGDTNSTIAGALAAAKMHIPVAHIEAGLRSFNKKMPEEINRIMTDHLSTLLFVPTQTGIQNLIKEGFNSCITEDISNENPLISLSGDVMYDNALYFSKSEDDWFEIKSKYGLNHIDSYLLFTIHRPSNTDNVENLNELLLTIIELADNKMHIVFPIHPRTKKAINNIKDEKLLNKFNQHSYIHLLPPLSYIEMLYFEKNAMIIATDSGGVQKEGYYFNKPIIILREETEWTELLTHNNAKLCGHNKSLIINHIKNFQHNPPTYFPHVFGKGDAAEIICKEISIFF